MIGGRRQMLLLLTLIVGVLGMHALVLVPATPAAGEQVPPPGATAPAAPHQGLADPSAATHEGMTTHDEMAAAAVVPQVAEHPGPGTGHGSMPSSTHQVLHLCLAILAALLVLGIAALALWPTLRPDRPGTPIGALVRRAPRRRPPPTSIRLAQLCVLRT